MLQALDGPVIAPPNCNRRARSLAHEVQSWGVEGSTGPRVWRNSSVQSSQTSRPAFEGGSVEEGLQTRCRNRIVGQLHDLGYGRPESSNLKGPTVDMKGQKSYRSPINILAFVIDDCTVRRYRLNYCLGEDIDANHVVKHLRLEDELTKRLLGSNPQTRWKTFHDCYSLLYRELPWLNEARSLEDNIVDLELIGWRALIGSSSKIFEVGSGRAKLLRYLMSLGHSCVAA